MLFYIKSESLYLRGSPEIMIEFCDQRLRFCTETIYRHLLLRMARMEVD